MPERKPTSQSVTRDTFVMTDRGARQVHELLGKNTTLIIEGKPFQTGGRGFFKTPRSPVFGLETQEGFSVCLTENHLVLKVESSSRSGTRTEWIATKNVKPGDKLLLHNHRFFCSWPGEFGEAEGYVLGLLLGEGSFKEDASAVSVWLASGGRLSIQNVTERSVPRQNRQPECLDVALAPHELRLSLALIKKIGLHLSVLTTQRAITPALERCSSSFYRGLLKGLFDCDGSANGTQKKGVSLRLSRRDISFLQALQRILLRLGIVSRITEERRPETDIRSEKEDALRPTPGTARHELLITNNNVQYFDHLVGFADAAKDAHLRELLTSYKRMLNRERFTATVRRITPGAEEDVYSVRVPGVNAFDANGFYVHSSG